MLGNKRVLLLKTVEIRNLNVHPVCYAHYLQRTDRVDKTKIYIFNSLKNIFCRSS